jgi:hypothetical protein
LVQVVFRIPAVQLAMAAIQQTLALVRVQQPGLTPAQQLREARARCREAILAANDAVDRATALASLKPMTAAEMAEKRGRPKTAAHYANSATAESRTNRTNGAASAMAIAQTNTTAMAMSAATTACGNPALAGGGNVQRSL